MHICVQTYAFMASTQMQCMEPVADPPPPFPYLRVLIRPWEQSSVDNFPNNF